MDYVQVFGDAPPGIEPGTVGLRVTSSCLQGFPMFTGVRGRYCRVLKGCSCRVRDTVTNRRLQEPARRWLLPRRPPREGPPVAEPSRRCSSESDVAVGADETVVPIRRNAARHAPGRRRSPVAPIASAITPRCGSRSRARRRPEGHPGSRDNGDYQGKIPSDAPARMPACARPLTAARSGRGGP